MSSDAKDQWKSLRKLIRLRAEKQSPQSVFGSGTQRGSIYRWGIESATHSPLTAMDIVISRMACGRSVRKSETSQIDWFAELQSLTEQFAAARVSPAQSARVVIWASAMPALIDHVDYQVWWDMLGELQRYRDSMIESDGVASLLRLMVGAELGLTLSWRLADLPSCRRLQKSSIDAVVRWCEHEEDSIALAIAGGRNARLALASLIRCQSIMQSTMNRKFSKQQKNVLADLATWVTALTSFDGGTAFAPSSLDMQDDRNKNGLLDAATRCEAETLTPAMNAARGKTQTGGRLVWEISLPETVHHCEQSQLAVMMCQWDVSSGRMVVDYSRDTMRYELYGKKRALISGDWETTIQVDGNEQRSNGPWVATCEFTDDDVHYLELEQAWSGGVFLQRQFMQIRDDRAVLVADTVIPRDDQPDDQERSIRYTSRLPLATDTEAINEKETREILLKHRRKQAMAIPLSANEWRTGTTDATLRITEDRHLLMAANGTGRLYTPLWFDLQKTRFKRKRTWRQLTVADELRIVRHNEAVGFRIQFGAEQWMIYRSLHGSRTRSVMGKHLIADFFASRFYLNDGSYEEIVSVDENDHP